MICKKRHYSDLLAEIFFHRNEHANSYYVSFFSKMFILENAHNSDSEKAIMLDIQSYKQAPGLTFGLSCREIAEKFILTWNGQV
jgi:hypothetical protein